MTRIRVPGWRGAILAPLLALLVTACAANAPTPAPVEVAAAQPADSLRSLFRQTYDEAIARHRAKQILAAPVIIQDLLGMTLIRAGGERIRYEMDKAVYFSLADNTHPPYGIYSIIAMNGYGQLDAEQLQWLARYRNAVEVSLGQMADNPVDPETKQRLGVILSSSRDFIDDITAAGSVSAQQFEAFVVPLRPLFDDNFKLAAWEQLRQFRARMEQFQAEYPEENWSQLRVVIMGFHQPRELWTLKQFFQWLLNEPGFEKRVVYAEFQQPFFGAHRARAEAQALELLTKVDFDLGAAAVFLGDETRMGRDILGPYARDILETWGASDFPLPVN